MKPTDFCNKHDACKECREFAETFSTMEEVWENIQKTEWMFWILQRTKPLTKDQSVRLAIAFAESCLQYVPADEPRPALAIQAAKNWIENPCEVTRAAAYSAYAAAAAYAAAYASASRAAHAAAYAAYAAAYSARAAARAAHAAYAAYADDAAIYAATDAARAAAWAADADAVAREKNCDIIRSRIPNPFV
jgi:hypothetical protein